MKIARNLIGNFKNTEAKDFCLLNSSQLTSQQPIFFSRIVYHDNILKKHQEVITYAEGRTQFSQRLIDYFRSEEWLIDYPPVLSVTQLSINELETFAYICPIGYHNQQPEYIQIIASEPLSASLEEYFKKSATILSKYLSLSMDWNLRVNEIRLLEQILQRVSHQLRNSLSLVALYAQNLWFGLKDHPGQEQAKLICQSVEKLDLNLSDLINCSQRDCLILMPQDLRKILVESIDFLQPAIQQKQLNLQLSDTSVLLMLDRLQIKQVFDNLLGNAIHFSPMHGTIYCDWQIFQGEALIKIADQGAGLSPADLQNIFNPFYTRRKGGTGLGLTIAKKIILDHQGSIWAQNLRSGGAQFLVILPR